MERKKLIFGSCSIRNVESGAGRRYFFFMNFMKNMVAKLKYAWSTTAAAAAAAAILYRNETNVRARRTKRREETGQRMQAVSEWAHRVTDYVSRLCFSKNVH